MSSQKRPLFPNVYLEACRTMLRKPSQTISTENGLVRTRAQINEVGNMDNLEMVVRRMIENPSPCGMAETQPSISKVG